MTMQLKMTAPILEIKSLDDDTGEIEGYTRAIARGFMARSLLLD